MTAIHAGSGHVAWIPAKKQASVFGVEQCMTLPKLLEGILACHLIRRYLIEISQIHNQSFPLVKPIDAMYAPPAKLEV